MAEKNNKNAEKWTEPRVKEMLKGMIDASKRGDVYYRGALLDEFNLYPRWWPYILAKFEDSKEIKDIFGRLDQKMEKNLFTAMSTGVIKETSGIFALKAKHKWADKQEHVHTVEPITINLNLR